MENNEKSKAKGMKQTSHNLREIALFIIMEVMEEGKFSHIVINQTLNKYADLDKVDRSFITKVCLGTIEHCITLDYEIDKYSKIKVTKMKPLIRNLLRMSAYQIFYLTQVPDSAACNEAVKITKKRGLIGLSSFVNGTLRSIVRGKDLFLVLPKNLNPLKRLSILYSMPEWIIKEFLDRFGIETEGILKALLTEKKTAIRVNESKITIEELKRLLTNEGVTIYKSDLLTESFVISGYDSLNQLPSFLAGYYQVQDESSMLVGKIASVKAYDYVIDVCAAPGGKSLHIADLLLQKEMNETKRRDDLQKGMVSARDLTESKVNLIKENIKRSGFQNIETRIQDATSLRREDIETADIIIADLPCSGLGILGKKPEIRYRMNKQQQIALAKLQREILKVVSKYIKCGGILIYSTCTINEEENEANFEFIQKELGLIAESIEEYLPEKMIEMLKDSNRYQTLKKGYLQILPVDGTMDGFFISRARKI